MTTDSPLVISIAGTGLIHSFGMINNLAYAARVKDEAFFGAMFPAFFESLAPAEYERTEQAFRDGTVKIEPGPKDGDAIVTVGG